MVHPCLAAYASENSAFRKKTKCSRTDAAREIDKEMHKAQRIFSDLISQFYVEQAENYLVSASSVAPLDGATPFTDASLKTVVHGHFSKGAKECEGLSDNIWLTISGLTSIPR